MTEHERHPHDDQSLESGLKDALRQYAGSPGPDARFIAALEQKLLNEPAASRSPGILSRLLAPLAAWWRQSAGPRQSALSAVSAVAVILFFIAAAALFVSWLGGIQQIASAPTVPALAPVSTGRPVTPTPPPLPTGNDATVAMAATIAARETATGAPVVLPITPTPPSATDFPHHQNAILVAPANDLSVPQSEFTRLGIEVVPTIDELQAHTQSERVEVVYLHPDAYLNLSLNALQQLYDAGMVIVVLDTPVSLIDGDLLIFEGYDDLPAEYFDNDQYLVAAAFQRQFETGGVQQGPWILHDFFEADYFWMLIHLVERRLQEGQGAMVMAPTPFPGTYQPPAPTAEGTHGPVPTPTPIATPHDGAPGATPSPTPYDGVIGTMPSPTPPRLEEIVPQALFDFLAAQGVARQDVTVTAYQPLPWPDLCLGVYSEGATCTLVVLSYGGQSVNYHVSSTGQFRRIPDYQAREPGAALLTWGSDDCHVLAIPSSDPAAPLAIATCDGEFTVHPFPDDASEARWSAYLDTYAPFTYPIATTSGFLDFQGTGRTIAGAEQQQEIAAWLRELAGYVMGQ